MFLPPQCCSLYIYISRNAEDRISTHLVARMVLPFLNEAAHIKLRFDADKLRTVGAGGSN